MVQQQQSFNWLCEINMMNNHMPCGKSEYSFLSQSPLPNIVISLTLECIMKHINQHIHNILHLSVSRKVADIFDTDTKIFTRFSIMQ